jgi:hypothetical protein
MVPPPKPLALALAERNLAKLRSDRAILAESLRHAAMRDYADQRTTPSVEFLELSGQTRALDDNIMAAHAELAKARKVHGVNFLEAVGPQVVAYESFLGELINLLDDAVGIGVDLSNYAHRNSLPLPGLISASPQMHSLVRRLRMLVNDPIR